MTDQRHLPPYVGCTDGGCVFGHPAGSMHTNGGCKCLDELRELYGVDSDGLYARVRSGLLRLRMRLERAETEADPDCERHPGEHKRRLCWDWRPGGYVQPDHKGAL